MPPMPWMPAMPWRLARCCTHGRRSRPCSAGSATRPSVAEQLALGDVHGIEQLLHLFAGGNAIRLLTLVARRQREIAPVDEPGLLIQRGELFERVERDVPMQRTLFPVRCAPRVSKRLRDDVLDPRHEDPDFGARIETALREVLPER
jgi:hypothetical protein